MARRVGLLVALVILIACDGEPNPRRESVSWMGLAYVQFETGLPGKAELCFGPQVGPAGGMYIAGCPGLKVEGLDLSALDLNVQDQFFTIGAVEITGTLDEARTVFTAIAARSLGPSEGVTPQRLVPIPEDWDCDSDAPLESGQVGVQRGIEAMPLAVSAWSDDLKEINAVAVDDDWFALACDVGLLPETVHDFFIPTTET